MTGSNRCAVLVTARLAPDAVERYEHAHRDVPATVLAALRTNGVRDWTIWREGVELSQLIIADDRAAIDAALTRQPEGWMRDMEALVVPGSGRVTEVRLSWVLRDGETR